MDFKVGQRVWVNSKKHIMYFLHLKNEKECRVAEDLHTDNYNNSRFDNDCVVDIKDIHQTADDMFKELGYDYFEDGDHADYYINNEKGLTIELRTYVKEFVKFNSKDKKRRGIDLEELQAIIQYYVEKGWIE